MLSNELIANKMVVMNSGLIRMGLIESQNDKTSSDCYMVDANKNQKNKHKNVFHLEEGRIEVVIIFFFFFERSIFIYL